jgi:hypothetical protein
MNNSTKVGVGIVLFGALFTVAMVMVVLVGQSQQLRATPYQTQDPFEGFKGIIDTTGSCGDGQINHISLGGGQYMLEQCEPPEQATGSCDSGYCLGNCLCATPAPVCGDNIVNQSSEECDPPGTGYCPGSGRYCSSECTCVYET